MTEQDILNYEENHYITSFFLIGIISRVSKVLLNMKFPLSPPPLNV